MTATPGLTALRKKLQSDLQNCYACPLHRDIEGYYPVPGEGPLNAQIMLVGRNPGVTENNVGKPFCGMSGSRLDDVLHDVRLASNRIVRRQRIYVTNVVKCFTEGNAIPPRVCVDACCAHVETELQIVKPKLLITCGTEAKGWWTRLVGTKTLTRVPACFHMIHPAAALRNSTFEAVLRHQTRLLRRLVSRLHLTEGKRSVRKK